MVLSCAPESMAEPLPLSHEPAGSLPSCCRFWDPARQETSHAESLLQYGSITIVRNFPGGKLVRQMSSARLSSRGLLHDGPQSLPHLSARERLSVKLTRLTAALPPASVGGSFCLSWKPSEKGGRDHFWCQETLLRVTVQPVTLNSPFCWGTPVNLTCGESSDFYSHTAEQVTRVACGILE